MDERARMTGDSEPTGASAFWTSQDELIGRARQLVAEGRFVEAEELLYSQDDSGGRAVVNASDEGLAIIARIHRDYGLTLNELLDKVRSFVPDATPADLERWREAGQLQHRVIDGRVCCFHREPVNLWRFCEEARERRDRAGLDRSFETRKANEARLIEHLQAVIEAADRTDRADVLPTQHTIRYKLMVYPDRPDAKPGSIVRCWLPFPQVYGRQGDVELIEARPTDYVLAPNVVDGCPLGGAPQRTVYFEQRVQDPAEMMTFEVACCYVSSAYYPVLDDDRAKPLRSDFPDLFLRERPPHIVFTPELKRIVAQVVGDEANPLKRAFKLFGWIDANIRYCAEQEYSTIGSFTRKALESGRGDCGILSMLFIAMCRCAGVPARWQSGWQTFPDAWNMHDWAEFYVEPWGWLPADASYGFKKSDDPRVRSFYFGHQDAYRMIVNLDYGCAFQPAKRFIRSEIADFQRGEVEMDGRNLYFDEWDWDFSFDVESV